MIATCFALVSFTAAIVVGVGAGNSTQTILLRATLVMLVCWVIGRAVGAVAQWAIFDHIKRYKQQHPIPDESVPDT